jgi:transcriptional regulator with XRE-family HTH domain
MSHQSDKIEARKVALGRLLDVQRYKLGLRQHDIAERAGVSLPSISQWELGHIMPSLEQLPGLCRAYKLTAEQIKTVLEEA